MANPITWRNVKSDTSRSVPRLLNGAQNSFNSAFDTIGNVLDKRQATQEENWDVRKGNNTQAFMDQLAGYRSPEAFEAARQAGELDKSLEGYGRQIDQDTARTALDSRLGQLQQQQTATNQYQDAQQARGNQDLRGQLTDRLYDGDVEGANALFDENQDQFVDPAAVRKELFAGASSYRGEERAQSGERRAEENQQWNRTVRDRQQEEWAEQDTLEGAVRNAADESLESRQATWKGIAEQAERFDIPVVNGYPDLSQASDKQTQAFKEQIQALGYSSPSDTERLNTFEEGLRESQPGIAEKDIRAARKDFQDTLTQRRTLAPADQNELDQQLSQLESIKTQKLEEVKRNYDEQTKSDPFINQAFDPYTSAADVVNGLSKSLDDQGYDASERSKLAGEVSNAMDQGIKVKGEHIKVTPGLAKIALMQSSDDFYGFNTSFDEAVKDIMKQKGFVERYKEGQNAYQDYLKEQSQINGEYLKGVSGAKSRVRSDSGMSSTPIDGFLRELNRRKPQ